MKKTHVSPLVGLSLIIPMCCAVYFHCGRQALQQQKLWNGKDFSGWTLFIPGDSVDVNDVWSVEQDVIRCKGVPNGYMRTNESYSDYRLHLEWRWVGEGSNSGVFLHCRGEDQLWPNCIECQLKSGNAGDFVIIGPGTITVDGEVYNNENRFLSIPHRNEGIEKSIGEWNTYDIVCEGTSITCSVNGVLQNAATDAFISSGPIALQSEGGPIEFKNIVLEKLR